MVNSLKELFICMKDMINYSLLIYLKIFDKMQKIYCSTRLEYEIVVDPDMLFHNVLYLAAIPYLHREYNNAYHF
jgi:hypothetical protein